MKKVGRNEPCPCGSGKKYKRCCLAAAKPPAARARAHDLEMTFFEDMLAFGFERFGREAFAEAGRRLALAGEQLALPWFAYVLEIEGATVAEHYAATERLPAPARAFLEAQRRSWLSVWEVVDFELGRSLTLRDLLSGEERKVHEVSATQSVRKRVALLGRVVDFEGECVLAGVHMQTLPPMGAAEVVARAKKRLRRKRDVPVERLRGEKSAAYLLDRWDDACDEIHRRAKVPPRLVNTEGHDLVTVVDHFGYEASAHDGLLERLSRIDLVDVERESPTYAVVTFHMNGNPKIDSWDNTIIGQATVSNGKLALETNSHERADRLRSSILEIAGDVLRVRGRSVSDPMAAPNMAERAERRDLGPDEPPPPEMLAALAEFKARHYETWPDVSLPALGGDTPRDHVRTAEGRRAVEVLLKDMEFMEQTDPTTAFDVDRLRIELGLSR